MFDFAEPADRQAGGGAPAALRRAGPTLAWAQRWRGPNAGVGLTLACGDERWS